MTRGSELLLAPALEQARQIREGWLRCSELCQLYLERIEAAQNRYYAFTEYFPERALYWAKKQDALWERRSNRSELPPFFGLPTAMKDMHFVRGMWTRMGSQGFCLLSPADDGFVANMRRAGFNLIGKTTTSELGSLPVVETGLQPATRNPFAPKYTSGGSSGGASAAVAAGLIPISAGRDGAGSIRIPSAYCSLFGMKPTQGRIPNAYGLPDADLLYSAGPMARSVADAAMMMDALCGYLESLGPQAGRPAPPSKRYYDMLEDKPPKLKVRLVVETHLGPTFRAGQQAARRVADWLEKEGHEVSEGVLDRGELSDFLPIWQHGAANAPIADWSVVEPVVQWMAEAGRGLTDADVLAQKRRVEGIFTDWWGDIDLMVSPTTSVPAPEVYGTDGLEPQEKFSRLAALGFYTAPFNLTGQPAMSFPMGRDERGVPQGVQLAARKGQDDWLWMLAGALEKAFPFRHEFRQPFGL